MVSLNFAGLVKLIEFLILHFLLLIGVRELIDLLSQPFYFSDKEIELEACGDEMTFLKGGLV